MTVAAGDGGGAAVVVVLVRERPIAAPDAEAIAWVAVVAVAVAVDLSWSPYHYTRSWLQATPAASPAGIAYPRQPRPAVRTPHWQQRNSEW